MKPSLCILTFLFWFTLENVNAITTYYMDKYCGETLDLAHGLQKYSIRLKLTENYWYQPDMNCMLTLETMEDEQLMFHFINMRIQSSIFCSTDWLMFHDGGSINSPTVPGLPDKYCGHQPPSGDYHTSRHMLTLYFMSDTSFQDKGFDMIITRYHTGQCYSYEYECSNRRCIDEGLTCNGYNPCGNYSDCPLAAAAIVGIVIGCICFVVIVAFGICCGCRRRRRRYRQHKMVSVAASYGTPGDGYNQPVPQQYPPPTSGYPTSQTPPPPYPS